MPPSPDLWLATERVLPEPDADRDLVVTALARAGVDARWAPWDDPTVDWGAARAVLIRSTWNYALQVDAFLAWCDRVHAAVGLWNPAPVVRWNAHKSYLARLSEAGVPTVPTRVLTRGTQVSGGWWDALPWDDRMVKPAVAGGSRGARRMGRQQPDLAWLQASLDREDLVLQPWLNRVTSVEERSLVFFDGAPTHAVHKRLRLWQDHEQVQGPFPIAPDELAVARAALDWVGEPLLQARVDLLQDDEGGWRVSELELIEPSLFLTHHPPAADAFAWAVAARLG
jgi:hypothetical protein